MNAPKTTHVIMKTLGLVHVKGSRTEVVTTLAHSFSNGYSTKTDVIAFVDLVGIGANGEEFQLTIHRDEIKAILGDHDIQVGPHSDLDTAEVLI